MYTANVVGNKINLTFEYNLEILNIVREIQGRRYEGGSVWSLPATPWHAHKVLELLPLFVPDEKIKEIANKDAPVPDLEYPEGIYDFQKEAVKFMVKTNGRCIIADEMGLGKTIEALAYIKTTGGKTLIIAPSNVIYKWEVECGKWVGERTCAVYPTGSGDLKDEDIHIMSYGILVSRYEQVIKIPYMNIICDEAHYVKNTKAARTRVVRSVVNSGIPGILFLSGTPFLNRPSELYPLLNMLDPLSYNNYFMFAKRYCGAQYIGGRWYFPPNIATNIDELAERLKYIMIRRTKRAVLTELPELTRTSIPIKMESLREYNKERKEIAKWLKETRKENRTPDHVLARLNVLRQIVGRSKTGAAVELAESVLNDGKKVVLFAHHMEVVEILYNSLSHYGAGVISGRVKPQDRQKIINKFLISDSSLRVMIITVAGAEGIDLFSASDIIFVEREWTPAKEEQAESRLHRNGQKNPVNAWYIVATGTIDEKFDRLVKKKREVFQKLITSDQIVENILEEL